MTIHFGILGRFSSALKIINDSGMNFRPATYARHLKVELNKSRTRLDFTIVYIGAFAIVVVAY